MAALSDYLENRLVDLILRGQQFEPPSRIYVGLYVEDPTDAALSGEVDAPSYQRARVDASLENWSGTQGAGTLAASNGASGVSSNNVDIEFVLPQEDWGQVNFAVAFDAPTGGNLLFHAPLSNPKIIQQGDSVIFTAGNFSLRIDD